MMVRIPPREDGFHLQGPEVVGTPAALASEHPLWLFTLRAQSWAGEYGTTAHFARRLGRLALAAKDPWHFVTGDMT